MTSKRQHVNCRSIWTGAICRANPVFGRSGSRIVRLLQRMADMNRVRSACGARLGIALCVCCGGDGAGTTSPMAGASAAVHAEAGAGGAATASAAGSAGASSTARLEDIDRTLGGFNQELPAPSVDCLTKNVL